MSEGSLDVFVPTRIVVPPVHMNGRIYDPRIGRFLQADPFVQAPAYTQSFNRYAYVLNNPPSYTDPSGYFWAELGVFVFEYVVPFIFETIKTSAILYGADTASNVVGDLFQNGNTAVAGTTRGAYGNGSGGDFGTGGAGNCFAGTAMCGAHANASGGIGSTTSKATTGGTDTTRTGNKFANGGATETFSFAAGETSATDINFERACSGRPCIDRTVVGLEGTRDLIGILETVGNILIAVDIANTIISPTPDVGIIGAAARSTAKRLSGKLAQREASRLGYTTRIPPQKAPFNSHGQPVFRKGNKYITTDADGHRGGVWKMYNKRGKRLGTFDKDLNKIGE